MDISGYMADVKDTLIMCLSTFFSIVLLAVRKHIEKWVNKTVDKFVRKLRKLLKIHKLSKNYIEIENQIQEIIVELRIKTKANRSHVFLFHNGEDFSCSHPMWKISCTHESVERGTSSQVENLQNIRYSCVVDLLKCFWEEDPNKIKGITRVSPEFCTCNNTKTCKFPYGIYLYDVKDMEEGYSKAHMEAQGNEYVMNVPIFDAKKNIIGFVGIDYCTEINSLEAVNYATIVCKATRDVEFLLIQRS